MNDKITDLAQKLFNEAGHQGNVYKSEPRVLKYFEDKAIKIMEEEK